MKRTITILMTICMLLTSLTFSQLSAGAKVIVPKSSIKSVSIVDTTTLKIKWKKVSLVSGYELYCKKPGASFKKIATLSKNKTSYTHKKLTTNKKYFYRIRTYKYVNGKKYYSNYSSKVCKGPTNYLLDIIEPYEKPYYYQTYDIKMGGEYYKNGYRCMGYGDDGKGNVTAFNLKGKYSKISFVAGVIDGGYRNDAVIYIYCDNNLIDEIPIYEGELPKKHTVNIEFCSQLKICVDSGRSVAMYDSNYGIADIKVYK